MVPPAPPAFSIVICWPRIFDMACVVMREIASVGPPAAAGTMTLIGRVGESCAAAAPTMDPSAAAIASRRIVFPPVGLVLVLMISAIIAPPIRLILMDSAGWLPRWALSGQSGPAWRCGFDCLGRARSGAFSLGRR